MRLRLLLESHLRQRGTGDVGPALSGRRLGSRRKVARWWLSGVAFTRLRAVLIQRPEITANLRRQTDPSHLLIVPHDPTDASSRLNYVSLVSCYNLFAIEQDNILHVIGHISDVLKAKLADCLKAALDLP